MAKDITILSADTSSLRFSIALLKAASLEQSRRACPEQGRRAELVEQFTSATPGRQSSDMLLEIDKLLSRNSFSIEDIDLFSVGLGPGSFTGLRIGLTTMRAMALALKKPIIGIPSIDALAHAAADSSPDICVIIDAKQTKVYARFYRQRKNIIKPASKIFLLPIDKLLARVKGPVLFTGDAIALYRDDILRSNIPGVDFTPEETWSSEAAIIGALSFSKWKKRYRDNVFTLSPLYIYPKECSISKHRKKS